MRIIVHIGHYKTGTTSLQRRFTDNRSELAAGGVIYPDLGTLVNPNGTVLPSHSPLVFELLKRRKLTVPFWYKDLQQRSPEPPTLESMVDDLHRAIDEADGRDLLLSSEELMRFGAGGGHEGLVDEFADLIGDHHTSVFCHLRRPDLHLRSWYNQLVKLGARRQNLSASVDAYFDKVHVDYAMALRPWVERFGVGDVVVHRYERRTGDVTDDLLGAFGRHISLPEGTEVWENERFPDIFIETLRIWNDLHPSGDLSAELRQTMIRAAARNELKDTRIEFLDRAARRQLHGRCVEMAAELDQLLGVAEPLFDDLDDMLAPTEGAITDVEANRRYAASVLTELFDRSGTEADEVPEPPAPVSPLARARSGIRAMASRARGTIHGD